MPNQAHDNCVPNPRVSTAGWPRPIRNGSLTENNLINRTKNKHASDKVGVFFVRSAEFPLAYPASTQVARASPEPPYAIVAEASSARILSMVAL